MGRRALNNNCLIIAAAGNNARRDQQRFGFVGIPANSPSIMAVAALDEQVDIAFFSARSLIGVRGGNVDIAGPGVRVFSSWNQPRPEQGKSEVPQHLRDEHGHPTRGRHRRAVVSVDGPRRA